MKHHIGQLPGSTISRHSLYLTVLAGLFWQIAPGWAQTLSGKGQDEYAKWASTQESMFSLAGGSETTMGGIRLTNTGAVYRDAYGSIENLQNCFDLEVKRGPIFVETKRIDGKLIDRYFVFIKGDSVVDRPLPVKRYLDELVGSTKRSAETSPPRATTQAPTETAQACNVVRIVKDEDKSIPRYEETKYNATLGDFNEMSTVVGQGYAKPIGGAVGEFLVQGIRLTMKENKFKDGGIDTEELGKVRILFSSSLTGTGFIALLTDEQLKKLDQFLAQKKAPATLATTVSPAPRLRDTEQGQGRGSFDRASLQQLMMGRLRENLGAMADDEWTVVSQRIARVLNLRRATFVVRGLGGERNPAVEALQKAIESNDGEEIRAKLQNLRQDLARKNAELERAQQELRAVLSLRQEAIITMTGLLDPP